MLPRQYRMRHSTEFTAVVRTGLRARRGHLVVHQLAAAPDAPDAPAAPEGMTTIGLVVGKSVGASVVRHRVSRRLRAQLSSRVDGLPHGSGTVVRALPTAATATSAELGADLDDALHRLARSR